MPLPPFVAPFLGCWSVDPEQCAYEFGEPPQVGQYTLSEQGEGIRFHAEFTAPDGEEAEIFFDALVDGEVHEYNEAPGIDGIMAEYAEGALITRVYVGDVEIAKAVRQIKSGGNEMLIRQFGVTPDGDAFENRAVYLRVAD